MSGGGLQAEVGPSSPLSVAALIKCLRELFAQLPDARGRSNNQRYAMADAALSAFSVFFTQSPSFLDYQIRMQQQQGKNNAQTLFGVHQIPCDNQIRNILDPVPPHTLFPLLTHIGDELHRQHYLDAYRSVNNTFLVAIDGADFFSSHTISCPCCSCAIQKNGDTLAPDGKSRTRAITPSRPKATISSITLVTANSTWPICSPP